MSKRNAFLLSEPVIVDGMRYVCLALRTKIRPRDLAATYWGTELESGYRLIARLAGVPVAVILALAPADLGRASNEVCAGLSRLARPDLVLNGAHYAG